MNFIKEIEALLSEIHQMYSQVINNLEVSLDYYLNSKEKDTSIYIDDDKINAYERALESLCMQILLKETVYSRDFRNVSGALELLDCLERIGDNAYDIKNMADRLKEGNFPLPIEGTSALIDVTLDMVKKGLVALVKEDETLANEIIKKDDIADKLYWNLINKLALLSDQNIIDGKTTIYNTHIIKYLERISDQATNIAEWVIYIKSGYHKDSVII